MTTDEIEEDLIDTRNGCDVSFLDLYSIDQISTNDISLILELARKFRHYKTEKLTLNKGCSQVNAFFENSTRTLASFDLSAKNLSMDTSNVGSSSSVAKGESFINTAQVLDAYNLKTIIVRSKEAGVPEMLARHTNASIINAGDGWHEHPTQALLDALTMLDHFHSNNLSGVTITIVGDIMHSRVFGSLVRILKKLDAKEIRISAPETLLPAHVENFGTKIFHDVEEALTGTNIVYALRVQEERGAKGYIPTLREYSKMYGISRKRMDLADKDAILMHPGPYIRDIDVHSALIMADEQSRILTQVENGMAIRKTLLWLLSNRMDGRVKEITRR